jgi:hypothetical protein
MLISDLGQGWYAFSATGLWFGPTVNDAEAYGAFHLDGESGELPGASSEECSYTLTRLTGDRWRIEEHPPESGIACGGMNATVEGTYNRSRR